MNYFKPGLGQQNPTSALGRRKFNSLGCNSCHMSNLQINHDRRVADVETVYDPPRGIFNKLFSDAGTLINVIDDGRGLPPNSHREIRSLCRTSSPTSNGMISDPISTSEITTAPCSSSF